MIVFGVPLGLTDPARQRALPSLRPILDSALEDTRLRTGTGPCIFANYEEMFAYAARYEDLEALVLMHEDCEIIDPRFLFKLGYAMAQHDVGVVGAIGSIGANRLAWWELPERRGRIGFLGDTLDFGFESTDVDIVDGVFMAISPWCVRNVPVDHERFHGFYGFDGDYSYAVKAAGKRVVVADIDLVHHTPGGFVQGGQPEGTHNEDAFRRANAIFQEKYRL